MPLQRHGACPQSIQNSLEIHPCHLTSALNIYFGKGEIIVNVIKH